MDNEIIAIANTGPTHFGRTLEFVITSYVVTNAMLTAIMLNPYDRNLKPLVSNIFEKAERRMILSKVSVAIIPNAKNPTRIKAVWIPAVADATAEIESADI